MFLCKTISSGGSFCYHDPCHCHFTRELQILLTQQWRRGGGECTRPGIVCAASGHSLVCAASGHSSSGTAKSGAPALAVCQKQNYYLKKHFSSAVLPYLQL